MTNFVIFHQMKVAKHIWDPCCHLVTQSGSWFSLITVIVLSLTPWAVQQHVSLWCQAKISQPTFKSTLVTVAVACVLRQHFASVNATLVLIAVVCQVAENST